MKLLGAYTWQLDQRVWCNGPMTTFSSNWWPKNRTKTQFPKKTFTNNENVVIQMNCKEILPRPRQWFDKRPLIWLRTVFFHWGQRMHAAPTTNSKNVICKLMIPFSIVIGVGKTLSGGVKRGFFYWRTTLVKFQFAYSETKCKTFFY